MVKKKEQQNMKKPTKIYPKVKNKNAADLVHRYLLAKEQMKEFDAEAKRLLEAIVLEVGVSLNKRHKSFIGFLQNPLLIRSEATFRLSKIKSFLMVIFWEIINQPNPAFFHRNNRTHHAG